MTGQTPERFRVEVREWTEESFPSSLANQPLQYDIPYDPALAGDLEVWRRRLAHRGYGAPTWPIEYGGAGLTQSEANILREEFEEAGAFNPIPVMAGMGVTMIGPTMLEYGTDEQKQRHLRGMASGEVRWCLGLSEPNAGSDLASLRTKAVDDGDAFVLNGQKIWTSGADISDWCGALVRTDSDAKKREGLSFLLFTMDQPGVETKPIQLISGASPFCEVFLTDARAEKSDLLGGLNGGWGLVKRLLQHERQGQTGVRSSEPVEKPLHETAKEYVGVTEGGQLADSDLRSRLTTHLMDAQAHALTISRITAEAKGEAKVSATASILKNSATQVAQDKAELTLEIMGSQGIGWEGGHFTEAELDNVYDWLSGKARSIYGGSYEIQNNIISKNILGLPETTQKSEGS